MSLRSRIGLTATLLVLAAILVNTLLQTMAARHAVLNQARAGGDAAAGVLARAVAFAVEGQSDAESAPSNAIAAAPQPPIGSSKKAGASTQGSHTGSPRPAGEAETAVVTSDVMRPNYPRGPARGKADPARCTPMTGVALRIPRVSPRSPGWKPGDSGHAGHPAIHAARRRTLPIQGFSMGNQWPRRGSNPHTPYGIRDFKSRASASFATRPEPGSIP